MARCNVVQNYKFQSGASASEKVFNIYVENSLFGTALTALVRLVVSAF